MSIHPPFLAGGAAAAEAMPIPVILCIQNQNGCERDGKDGGVRLPVCPSVRPFGHYVHDGTLAPAAEAAAPRWVLHYKHGRAPVRLSALPGGHGKMVRASDCARGRIPHGCANSICTFMIGGGAKEPIAAICRPIATGLARLRPRFVMLCCARTD